MTVPVILSVAKAMMARSSLYALIDSASKYLGKQLWFSLGRRQSFQDRASIAPLTSLGSRWRQDQAKADSASTWAASQT